MKVEYEGVMRTGMSDEIAQFDGNKPIDSVWLYAWNQDPDRMVTGVKARLVARGDRQVQGEDYDDTFPFPPSKRG